MAKKSAPKKPAKSSGDDTELPEDDIETGEELPEGADEAMIEAAEEAADAPADTTESVETPDEEPPAAKDEPPPEESEPPADTSTITIEGDEGGTVPLYVEGEMTRLEKGVPIEVTEAQIAALKQVGVKFKKGKSSGKK